jgi:hypothetical protein
MLVTMGGKKIILNPLYKMVLEYTFDELVKEIWGK